MGAPRWPPYGLPSGSEARYHPLRRPRRHAGSVLSSASSVRTIPSKAHPRSHNAAVKIPSGGVRLGPIVLSWLGVSVLLGAMLVALMPGNGAAAPPLSAAGPTAAAPAAAATTLPPAATDTPPPPTEATALMGASAASTGL